MSTITLKQVAEEAGVSVQTVSNVLNDRTQQRWPSIRERADKIRDIADRLGYKPNAAARAMHTQKSSQVGVLLRNNPQKRFNNPGAFETILGMNEYFESAGYVLSIIRVHDVEADQPTSRVFQERALDGMIVMDVLPDVAYKHTEQWIGKCIWLDTNISRDACCIRRDEIYTGALAAEKMAGLGYKKILWVGPTKHDPPALCHYSVPDRWKGVSQEAKRRNLQVETFTEIEATRSATAMQKLGNILSADTAVIAYDVEHAYMVRQAGVHADKRSGWDFPICCCDSAHQIDRDWPDLSRVVVDRFDIGRQAAAMMMQLLDEPKILPGSKMIQGQWQPGCTAWPITREQ